MNGKLKSNIINWFGFIDVVLVLLYMLFIFLVGTRPQYVPGFLISSVSTRNFFISSTHTIGTVFAVIYFLQYLDAKLHDTKLAAIGIINSIVYILALVLVWYCYIIKVTDPLMFVVCVDGVLMSILLWVLTYAKYTTMDGGAQKTGEAILKLLAFASITCFIVGIFTYYGITGRILNSMFNAVLPTNSADALSIFLYIVAAILQCVLFVMMSVMDRKRARYIEMLKDRYRKTKRL
ncbi:MAG: hypothetical protein IJY55_03505 [Clostridia bacterium]|nr:hypothetical protein [Clostridia bacterium]